MKVEEPISVYQSSNAAVNLHGVILEKVTKTPANRLHTVEEFAEKLENAVLERL